MSIDHNMIYWRLQCREESLYSVDYTSKIIDNSQQFPGEMNIKFRTKTNKIVDISILVSNWFGRLPTVDILVTEWREQLNIVLLINRYRSNTVHVSIMSERFIRGSDEWYNSWICKWYKITYEYIYFRYFTPFAMFMLGGERRSIDTC